MENRKQRIVQIREEIAGIGEFAEGTLSCSSSRYRLKDGTWKRAKPHWKFQSLGPRGKRRYVHVPAACVERVKELVENGKRYRALESEYAQLVTDASMEGAGEKLHFPAATPLPAGRRSRRGTPGKPLRGEGRSGRVRRQAEDGGAGGRGGIRGRGGVGGGAAARGEGRARLAGGGPVHVHGLDAGAVSVLPRQGEARGALGGVRGGTEDDAGGVGNGLATGSPARIVQGGTRHALLAGAGENIGLEGAGRDARAGRGGAGGTGGSGVGQAGIHGETAGGARGRAEGPADAGDPAGRHVRARGEGGHLPGHKVDVLVGRLRHARPGTSLISPPPHHDIYSIEDLAQLVHDLKCVNPSARVSVKLVSEAGVGTVAAGVAKAHADAVVISGFDGGTGAAPLSSQKHAGAPWEPGLAEAHQTLLLNDLRSRVRLQVDGQLRTGRDIVIAAILGADEFAFGTSMLVSLGCVQCRHCNLNACPVGIATQDPALRAKFAGKPEHLQTYFRFLAQEVREILASLGLPSLAAARGRTDLLLPPPDSPFDFTALLSGGAGGSPANGGAGAPPPSLAPVWSPTLDPLSLLPAIFPSGGAGGSPANGGSGAKPLPLRLARPITNSHRSIGASLAGEIASRFGPDGLPDGTLAIDFTGTAGQSFGAFLAHGVTFNLRGAANDYLGKSLSGGTITVAPPPGATFAPEDNTIAGNVVAYGATTGSVFISGRAGERFGVRNSGATLVAEGVGDHALEYMTGGEALILGPTGINFGAGMTGGEAFVLDLDGDFDLRCNLDSVDLHSILPGTPEEATLLRLLRAHHAATSSPLARRLLSDWPSILPRFLQVLPASAS